MPSRASRGCTAWKPGWTSKDRDPASLEIADERFEYQPSRDTMNGFCGSNYDPDSRRSNKKVKIH